MTHFDDQAPCDYFGEAFASILLAIGWLANGRPFSVGKTSRAAFDTLNALLIEPWQPMVFMGTHACELCQFDPPCGNANLWVPSGAQIFVCPELITHYMAAHHYRPPDAFLEAVMNCPNTRTVEYKKLFLASGGRPLVAVEPRT